MGAAQLLDQVQTLAHLATLEAGPQVYAERLAQELGEAVTRDEIAARDDQLRDALARIDALAKRVMRIQLEHVLADDTSIGPPTRKVFAATVTDYANRLDLLDTRARDVASRSGARDPAGIAERVVEAARATLALRGAVGSGVLALIAELAAAGAPLADRSARDRSAAEPARRAWSAVRRELEAIAARPDRVVEAPFAARLATWPDQLDDPDPANEPTFADMIELD